MSAKLDQRAITSTCQLYPDIAALVATGKIKEAQGAFNAAARKLEDEARVAMQAAIELRRASRLIGRGILPAS